MNIQKGDYVHTPRFLNVQIQDVFLSVDDLKKAGYTETTHFRDENFEVLGKSIDSTHMEFAAARKSLTVFVVASARRYAPEDTVEIGIDGVFWSEYDARQYALKDIADTIEAESIDENKADIDYEFLTIDTPDCHHYWKIEPVKLPTQF